MNSTLNNETLANNLETISNESEPIFNFDLKLLVIDNWRSRNESLRELLQDFSSVDWAGSIDYALNLIRWHTFDVIFLDVEMVDRKGAKMIQRIREIDPNVSIVLVIGDESLQTAEEVLCVGGHDFVQFPFETYEIHEVIRNASHRTQVVRFLRNLSLKGECHE